MALFNMLKKNSNSSVICHSKQQRQSIRVYSMVKKRNCFLQPSLQWQKARNNKEEIDTFKKEEATAQAFSFCHILAFTCIYLYILFMPVFNLFLSARTENVDLISAHEDVIWLLKIKCSGCNQNFPKEVGVTRSEEVEMQKQHGTANFTAKCKNCERKGYIAILNTSTYEARADEDGLIKACLAAFECRGVEIQQAVMNDYFNVSARGSNTVFENADFSDLWAEYDEAISAVVQVEDPRLDIVKSKDK